MDFYHQPITIRVGECYLCGNFAGRLVDGFDIFHICSMCSGHFTVDAGVCDAPPGKNHSYNLKKNIRLDSSNTISED